MRLFLKLLEDVFFELLELLPGQVVAGFGEALPGFALPQIERCISEGIVY